MTFTTWGQSATHSTTVLASPAPTTTSCTVAAIGTVRVGMSVFIDVSGTPEQTAITGITGANVTFSPALSGAPDVGGDFISYHQPLTNTKLNGGALWKATDTADLAATSVTNMPDGTLAYVPGAGVYRLDLSSPETINQFNENYVLTATGGGQWILDVSASGDASMMEDVIFDYIIDFLGDLPEYIKTQLDYLTASIDTINSKIGSLSQTLTTTATLDFPSISGNSNQALTVTVTGAAVNDEVTMGLPALASGLIANAWVSAANTVTVRLSNVTGSPIDPASQTYRIVVRKYA
jgi:hypothetical protein